MPIASDFSVAVNGDIRHTSGSTNYTVLELHRYLQDLADNASTASDDLLDITSSTPSDRSTNNIITLNAPYNIDDTAAQYLYDGSITQDAGDTIYAGLVVVGAVSGTTEVQITQDEAVLTSFWATGINPDAAANIISRMLIKTRAFGHNIDGQKLLVWARELGDTYAEFSVTMALGNNVAALFTGTDLNNPTAAGTISGWTSVVNTEGYQLIDIAGTGTPQPYYSKWDQGTQTKAEMYERTKWLQRRGTAETLYGKNGDLFRGISHQFNYGTQTNNFTQNAIIAWGTQFAFDTGTGTAPAVGQYWENTTSGGVGKVVFATGTTTGTVVIQRETTTDVWSDTDVFALLNGTGEFLIAGAVTGQTNIGGSGIVLADLDSGATGTLWIQLVSGSAPANTYELWQRGVATIRALVSSTITSRTVPPNFLGSFTGTAIIGAFGIGIVAAQGIAADTFTPLDATTVNPPNNQNFSVFGLNIAGTADRVLVANNNASAPDFAQFTTTATYNGAGVTTIAVSPAIPADTPQVTNLRIELDTGVYRLIPTVSWTGSTFTIASTDFTDPLDATTGNNLFLGYIDKAAGSTTEFVTLKYISDRTMFVRVRNGGASPIKTFESTATFGSGGGSATAIRTSDS